MNHMQGDALGLMSDVRCLLDAASLEVSGVIKMLMFTYIDRHQDIGHQTLNDMKITSLLQPLAHFLGLFHR
jgi:hypothetical protein